MASGSVGPFSRRTLAFLVGVSASSLALAVAFLVRGAPESAEVASSGADAFSRSALGHRALVVLLRQSGIPVVVSRYDSGRRAGATGILVLAEPDMRDGDAIRGRRLAEMLKAAGTTLLVLPKWRATEDPARPGWVRDATMLSPTEVGRALSAAGVAARIVRSPREGTESCRGLAHPVTWAAPQLLEPTLPGLRPVVTCEGGILLGMASLGERRLFVLSDPDLVANHALAAGENEDAALEMLDKLRPQGNPLVFDETLHGHERSPALWRELFAFPLLPAVVQAGLVVAALVLSGLFRFGAPEEGRLAFDTGKGVLIENTAFLLRSAGHSAYTLGRYFDATLAEIAQALHLSAGSRPGERSALLQAVARQRGVRTDLRTLEAQVERLKRDAASPTALVAAARRVHRFREDMLRGPRGHPGR